MEEKNYVLSTSFGRSNIQNRLWYVMAEADLDVLKDNETVIFGDKAFAITEKTLHIMGNDDTWYEIPVEMA